MMNEMQMYGDWKIVNGSKTHLKVVGFPGGESMWVEVIDGDDFEGQGRIDNHPVCSELSRGDLVTYGNGSDEAKPEFISALRFDAEFPPASMN